MNKNDQKVIDTFNTGNKILGTIALAVHKQATEYGDQYKNILKNEIKEYEQVINKLMDIIDFYEMECVPYGKIRRLSDKYESIVYRAVSNTRRNNEESSFDID